MTSVLYSTMAETICFRPRVLNWLQPTSTEFNTSSITLTRLETDSQSDTWNDGMALQLQSE